VTDAVLWVCISCREKGGPAALELRPGFRLHQRLAHHTKPLIAAGVRLEGHACLSACDRPCAVGFSGPSRWSYVFGRLHEADAVSPLLACARLYAAAPDGFLARGARPQALQATIISRVPPP
jgi:predicted metal-binding protein